MLFEIISRIFNFADDFWDTSMDIYNEENLIVEVMNKVTLIIYPSK